MTHHGADDCGARRITLRGLLFQLHWALGISAGLVLAVVGASGALLSFEDEIVAALNPPPAPPAGAAVLDPATLVARVQQARPQAVVDALGLSPLPHVPARVTFADPAGGRRGERHRVDRYTAALLPEPRGEAFLHGVMRVHRWLGVGEAGKQIVAASTLALIYFCVSGLYLRWPRRWRSPRVWFAIDRRARGRALLRSLHAVLGTWTLLLYLLAAGTGLYWSYEAYREALHTLAGSERHTRDPPRTRDSDVAAAPAANGVVGVAWRAFSANVDTYHWAEVRLPAHDGAAIEIRYLPGDAAHERAFNTLRVDATDGHVLAREAFTDKPLGARLIDSIFPLHRGSYFGRAGTLAMMVASAIMPLFAITGWLLYVDRRRLHRTRPQVGGSLAVAERRRRKRRP